MKNLTMGLITLALMTLLVLSCSQSDDRSSNSGPNSTTNGNSNDKSNNSGSNTTAPVSPNDADVAGNYELTGKNPAGQSYTGNLTIRNQGEVYQFSWNVGGSTYDGVGVRDGNLMAVGYNAGDNGKGCGAAIYRIGAKTLEGKIGGWSFNQAGRQSALLIKEVKDGGIYTVTGTDVDGSDYRGELFVANSKSDVYQFAFANNGKAKYYGTGIKVENYFGAGIGVKKCGYMVYEIRGDRLEAAWGVIGDNVLGTEIATRK